MKEKYHHISLWTLAAYIFHTIRVSKLAWKSGS